MSSLDGLDKLFFELASESRLGILLELQAKDLKMQEVARKVNLTHTEAFRQLQRLSEALLIQKQPDGSYSITQNGRLLLEFSNSFRFVQRFKRSLLTRDLQRLPYQFINRVGELSEATLSTDTNEMINSAERLIGGAEKFLWLMAQRPLTGLSVKTGEAVNKEVAVRLIVDAANAKFYENAPATKSFEMRIVPAVPAVMLVSEKAAGISLPSLDNRGDNAVFYGESQKIVNWACDLFLYFWQQGKQFSH